MITLDVLEEFRSQAESQLIEHAANATLQHQSAPADADLSIVITDNDSIQALNRQFRAVDAPTDVLSFPAELTDPESGTPYLGDVIISHPRAKAQAQAGGHSVEDELQLLVVHGVLHLLGHDHAEADEKKRMWTAQAEILGILGINEINLPI
ncbi:MAG: rRNA maturation RNase YbeY [Chloroflexota bacterium]|nr:rRNA maturation RNase YbeY [Chloroflexota bacterium]